MVFSLLSVVYEEVVMNVKMKRILLVEDDPNDVELTLTALKEFNLANEVVVAGDGAEALDFLFKRGAFSERANGNPAVILLDLKLPKISGIEVLKKIRETEKLKMIPVVILTSSREEKDLNDGYSLGTNAYVVKPLEFQQFLEAIKQLGAFWALINEAPPGSVTK
jgi:CheY-like chemotaxis protein